MQYLIAHKVYGEPAFEVATKIKCPVCEPIRQGLDYGDMYSGCNECNDEQYWWITNYGHRAYPYDYWSIGDLFDGSDYPHARPLDALEKMPPDCPEHFEASAALKGQGIHVGSGRSLLEQLGLAKPLEPMRRW